jgi:hypothetical protein
MATACKENKYYSGQGSILLAERNELGQPLGFISVGNVTSLSISVETTLFEHKESCTGNRGIDKLIVQEVKANVSFTMEHFSKENLALALYGTSDVITGTTVTDEVLMAYKGKWSALKNIQVKNVVITNQDGTTTYTLGTDYTLNLKAGSVMILSDGNIANGSALKVNYAFDD